jgi:hypothetical protein
MSCASAQPPSTSPVWTKAARSFSTPSTMANADQHPPFVIRSATGPKPRNSDLFLTCSLVQSTAAQAGSSEPNQVAEKDAHDGKHTERRAAEPEDDAALELAELVEGRLHVNAYSRRYAANCSIVSCMHMYGRTQGD